MRKCQAAKGEWLEERGHGWILFDSDEKTCWVVSGVTKARRVATEIESACEETHDTVSG